MPHRVADLVSSVKFFGELLHEFGSHLRRAGFCREQWDAVPHPFTEMSAVMGRMDSPKTSLAASVIFSLL